MDFSAPLFFISIGEHGAMDELLDVYVGHFGHLPGVDASGCAKHDARGTSGGNSRFRTDKVGL